MWRLLRCLSFWTFGVFATLVLYQESLSVADLMLGKTVPDVPEFCGIAFQVFLVSLIIDVCRRIARRILLVPVILFYGGYYALYIQQYYEIRAEAESLRSNNPTSVLAFDPETYDLVVRNPEADYLAAHYRIPVVYTPYARPIDLPQRRGSKSELSAPTSVIETYRAARLLSPDDCAARAQNIARRQALGERNTPMVLPLMSGPEPGARRYASRGCVTTQLEAPKHKVVTAVVRGWLGDPNFPSAAFSEQFVELDVAGETGVIAE